MKSTSIERLLAAVGLSAALIVMWINIAALWLGIAPPNPEYPVAAWKIAAAGVLAALCLVRIWEG